MRITCTHKFHGRISETSILQRGGQLQYLKIVVIKMRWLPKLWLADEGDSKFVFDIHHFSTEPILNFPYD